MQPVRIELIQRDGFDIFPGVLQPEEVAELKRALHRMPVRRSRAGARHILCHPGIHALAKDPRLMKISLALLGPAAVPFRATLFDKSPSSNWLVMWHQDTALPLRAQLDAPGWSPWSIKEGMHYAHAPAAALERVLALRVHLDDSTSSNGPLRVLPQTHTGGVLNDQEIQRLANASQSVECTISAGGIVAMRPLTIHASSKSQSELPRRVIHIEFASSLKFENGLELTTA